MDSANQLVYVSICGLCGRADVSTLAVLVKLNAVVPKESQEGGGPSTLRFSDTKGGGVWHTESIDCREDAMSLYAADSALLGHTNCIVQACQETLLVPYFINERLLGCKHRMTVLLALPVLLALMTWRLPQFPLLLSCVLLCCTSIYLPLAVPGLAWAVLLCSDLHVSCVLPGSKVHRRA